MRRALARAAALGGALLWSRHASALRIPPDGAAGEAPERLGGISPNIMFAAGPGEPELRAPCEVFKLYHQTRHDTALRRFMPETAGARANLVVGVVTSKNLHAARAHPHFVYHSAHLTRNATLLYFTNGPLEERGALAPVDDTGGDTYSSAVHRHLTAWRYVAGGCHGLDYRWYIQIDDDTAVSVPRLGLFLSALGTRLGDPYTKSTLIGRMTAWPHPSKCGEVFGGNGILATRGAMQEFDALEAGTWDDAHRRVTFGDGMISELAHAANCSMVQMHAPFGLGPWHWKDEMTRGSTLLLRARWANAAVSLHKVKTPRSYKLAERIFALPGAEMSDYAALLDEVQGMFDRRCVETSVRRHDGKEDEVVGGGGHSGAAQGA